MKNLRIFYPAKLINKELNEVNNFNDYLIESSGSIVDYCLFDHLEEFKKSILFDEIYPEIIYDTTSNKIFISSLIILKENEPINIVSLKTKLLEIYESDIFKSILLKNEIYLSTDVYYVTIEENKKDLIFFKNE